MRLLLDMEVNGDTLWMRLFLLLLQILILLFAGCFSGWRECHGGGQAMMEQTIAMETTNDMQGLLTLQAINCGRKSRRQLQFPIMD